MRSLFALVLVFAIVFQNSKCDNGQYQNPYGYQQRNDVRQLDPTNQAQGGGQPMNGGQPIQGNPPVAGGQQPQLGNPQGGGQPMNGQFNTPGNQQFQPNPNQPPFNPSNPNQPPFNPTNPNQPPFNPSNPNQPPFNPSNPNQPPFNPSNPNQPPFQPQPPFQNPYLPGYPPQIPPPYGLNLTPEGQQAYSFLLQQLGSMLNNPTTRQELETLINNMGMLLSYPKSLQIIQEFTSRWLNALNQLPSGANTNVIVQQVQPSSFFDFFKKKGAALVNLANDITQAKAKAINTAFGDTPVVGSFVRSGTNLGSSAVQGVTGMITPFLDTPSSSTITTVNTPVVTSY